jgi:hypothetical protein
MVSTSSKKPRKSSKKAKKPKPADIELEPDAMERFERAVDKMAPARRPAGKK